MRYLVLALCLSASAALRRPLPAMSASPANPKTAAAAAAAGVAGASSRFGNPERIFKDAPGVAYPTTKDGGAYKAEEVVNRDLVSAVRLRHVLLAAEPLAEELLGRVRRGEDFGLLAEALSACGASRSRAGYLGWTSMDGSDTGEQEVVKALLPEASLAEFLRESTLKPGDARMVRSDRGWHLVLVDDVRMKLFVDVKARGRAKGTGELSKPLKELFRAKERSLTYSVLTMGCQMNSADSERMAGELEGLGFSALEDAAGGADVAAKSDKRRKTAAADVLIVNTCSIRDHAEQKVYSALGPYAARKRKGEPIAIVVAGCVAQQEGSRLLRRFPEIDAVIGPQYANRLGEVLETAMEGNQVVAVEPTYISEDVTRPRRDSSVCAWTNVIYGCNERCTYCVVPGTRGVEQSRPPEAVLAEVSGLAAQGYREVTLLGQNIDSYGRDMVPKRRFADLLRLIDADDAALDGIARVRFATSHPRYMSEAVVDAVASSSLRGGRLMPVFHIPAQSGSDAVLKAMGRGYTRQRYMQIVERIEQRFEGRDVAITSDFIVGFPGETEEDFEATLSLMEDVKFSAAMCAAYSPRPNTPAALWDDQLPDDVKERRLRKIQKLQEEHALFRSTQLLDTVQDVLVEGVNPKDATQVQGRTPTNRLVFFEGDRERLTGKIVPVRITEARPFSLSGELEA